MAVSILYSSASDGYIEGHAIDDYPAAHDAATGTVYDTDNILKIGQMSFYQIGVGAHYYIYRGFLFFDTSVIPEGAIILSATLSIYGATDYLTTDFDITIQNGQPTYPHDPLQAGDYLHSQYSGNYGTFNTSGFSTSGYNDITISDTSVITKGGTTKLCLRSSRDIDSIAPTVNEYVEVYTQEKGTGYIPKLEITWRLPSSTPGLSPGSMLTITGGA